MNTGKSLAILPLFVRDYITATRHLSLAERGAYTDLLFFQWELGALPLDTERLARLVGCSSEEFASVWPALRSKFDQAGGGLANPRLEQHRKRARELSDKRAAIGREGGKQSGKQRASKRQAIALARTNSPSPSPSPDSGVLEDSNPCPLADVRAKRAYEGEEFREAVVAAYHDTLPDLPRVKMWTKKRQQALNARIRERLKDGKAADTLDYWRGLFEQVRASDFLCGRSADFRADLEWLLRPENFAKVIEGRYAPRQRAAT